MSNHPSLTRQQYRAVLLNDFSSFAQFAYSTLNPGKPYYHSAHIDLICDRLQRCYERDITRLIINIPPRSLKSTCASIAFPVWVLLKELNQEIMCISYGDELARDFGLLSRQLIQHNQFRQLFPELRLTKDRNTPIDFKAVRGGTRRGISTGGAITGRGADIIIIDDPLKASDIHNKELDSVNKWFNENVIQRLNNKNTGVIILIMQRLHIDDLTGHLLGKSDDWKILKLPAIAQTDEVYRLKNNSVYKRKEGNALHPDLESLDRLDNIRKHIGTYNFNSQYLQDPSSPEESLIEKDWFGSFVLDEFMTLIFGPNYISTPMHHIIQSWDTAQSENQHSDYTVGITLVITNGNFYIIDVFREKLNFTKILDAVQQKQNEYSAEAVIIESAFSGDNVIELLRDMYPQPTPYKPVGSKHNRLSAVSGMIESGHVLLPEDAPWREDFVHEVTRFPNMKHDDQVDALSQLLMYARDYLVEQRGSAILGSFYGMHDLQQEYAAYDWISPVSRYA